MTEKGRKNEAEKERDPASLEEKLKSCRELAEEYLAGWKRERADLINFKRGETERIQKSVESAKKDIIKDFLSVLDSFYLLEKYNASEIEGFANVKKQITSFLDSFNLKEIECLGQEFDPNIHEAVEIIEGETQNPVIVEEIQKGYIINDKVIRPSKVKVAFKQK